ncbi:MAG: efflux RND transporter periplasmic adaptor subunit [Nannocystaceae bacterium]
MLALRHLLLASLLVAACGTPAAAPGKGAPPMAEVAAITVAPAAVTLTRELPGRVAPRRLAEVRARVNGIVEARLFTEGSVVKEGQPLYRIEATSYKANLASARARLAQAESTLGSTRDMAERDAALLESGSVSREAAENSAAALRAREAEIAAGRAAVREASISLDYTTIDAPIAGRIGRSLVTEGAYVQQTSATLMASIQQIDEVYVDLTQSVAELHRLRRALESDRLRAPSSAAKVTLVLDDGSLYAEAGTLEFTDVTVDEGTASVTLRAVFPNPRGELLPGMFVRARIEEGEDPAAILVPQRAVSRDPRGQATLMVVGAEDKVERRVVVADRVIGDAWRIVEGLAPGDRVIVDGLQRATAGAQVKVVPAELAATPAASPTTASPTTATTTPSPTPSAEPTPSEPAQTSARRGAAARP